MRSMSHYFKLIFRFKLAPRLNRLQYLLLHIILAGLIIVDSILFFHFPDENYPMLIIAIVFILKIYISVPRLHDCDTSGWWILAILPASMFMGGLPMIALCVWPGTKGENTYGNPSKGIWIFKKVERSPRQPIRLAGYENLNGE